MIPVGILTASQTSSFSYLLDLYPNAAAAYSLRKLRVGYTGFCIQVRRSSDNTTQNIGFVNNVVDTASLLLFTGSSLISSGFVTIWYDQSGNNKNATSSLNNNPPLIVFQGAIFTVNGLPSLFWDFNISGGMHLLVSSFTAIPQPISTYSISKLTNSSTATASVIYDNNSTNAFGLYYTGTSESPTNKLGIFAGSAIYSITSNTNLNLISSYYNTTNTNLYVNNVLELNGVNIGSNSLDGITIGNIRVSAFYNIYDFQGYIQELIFYPSNQIANNSGINANINSFYTIY